MSPHQAYLMSAWPPVAVAALGPAGAEAAVEKDEFDVVLLSAGDKKIQVIKEVRAITSLCTRRSRRSKRKIEYRDSKRGVLMSLRPMGVAHR